MQPIPILMAAPTVLILFLSWTLQPAGAGVLDRIAEEGVMRAGTMNWAPLESSNSRHSSAITR